MDVEFVCPKCGRMTRFDTAQQPFGKKKLCKGCGDMHTLTRETTREATFGRIAKTAKDAAIRARAVSGLSDVNGLFEALRGDESEIVRLAALKNLVAIEEAVDHAARFDPHPDVRKEAIAHIENQAKLGALARSEPDARLRRAIVLRITDENVLTAIACNGNEEPPVRCAALERITNADIVRALMADKHPGVQAKAKERADELDVEGEVEWE